MNGTCYQKKILIAKKNNKTRHAECASKTHPVENVFVHFIGKGLVAF
jgi:hypothetical protein